MKLRGLLERSVVGLLRVASVLALIGLALMGLSVAWPRPLPVIVALSVGHALGIGAFLCYLLAVVVDARRFAPLEPRASAQAPSPAPAPPAEAALSREATSSNSQSADADDPS